MEKLVLIDGNSLLNRAFYATPIFTTKDGKPTNAIFGFVKLLFKILGDLKPKFMVVAFDLKAPTFRHKMYSGYKATRKPMPDELAAQIMPLKALLSAMNIKMCEKEGIEADDIIGTLSTKFDVHSYIYTGDRDSYQLVDERTDVYFTKKGVSDLLKLDCTNFKEQVGIEPKQVIDLKALMGDKSDNIPGVTGVGEKTAFGLLEKYGTLDGIYENIEEVKGALKDKLIVNKEQAYLSYTLATIDRNCQLDINLADCTVEQKYSQEVKKLFAEFEFKSLLSLDIFNEEEKVAIATDKQLPEIVVCNTAEELEKMPKEGVYYIDARNDGGEIFIDGVQYSIKCSVDLLSGGVNFDNFLEKLKEITSNKNNTVVLYDCKQFMHEFDGYGITLDCNFEDISVMKYLVDYFDTSENINELCNYYGYDNKYSAFVLADVYKKYTQKLRDEGEEKLYFDIEKPLINVLYRMEKAGMKVNLNELDAFAKTYNEKINSLSTKIFEICGCEFNLNSPTQLGDVLFEKLGLKSGKKNKKGGYSTSADVLEKLAEDNEVVRLILSYRQYQKLYSTYIEGFRPLIDKRTGLVHTTYNQTITATGRLSSANPNLQNIPVREEEGRELRKLFVPREGNVFIDADYSQIELRLLANFSGCKELIEAYNNGEDIHAVTASQVFGVPQSEVTSKMRREAKAVNFGIIYGISDYGLAKNLNIPVKTAREYIEKYFEHYSAIKEYMDNCVNKARECGYAETLTGRKRYIREINSSNYNLRQFGERAAMNMPLQGSSADIIKIAMINVERALKENGLKTKLILQVHDELLLDAPIEEEKAASEILKREMENAVKLNVPLTVDVHSGKNWYEAK
jgi:DNA polymerase-1